MVVSSREIGYDDDYLAVAVGLAVGSWPKPKPKRSAKTRYYLVRTCVGFLVDRSACEERLR